MDKTERGKNKLSHYGILGMKWGVRRARSKSTGRVSGGHDDHEKAKKLKGRSIKDLSNSELKTLTSRMQLERQYKNLRKDDLSFGKQLFNDIVVGTGKELVKDYLKKQYVKTSKKIVKDLAQK